MAIKLNSPANLIPLHSSKHTLRTPRTPLFDPKLPKTCRHIAIISCSYSTEQTSSQASSTTIPTQAPKSSVYFKTLEACKLGIARYPDFQYDATGGSGTAALAANKEVVEVQADELEVSFDVETLYIPPLSSSTTRFLGLPLPPFLKIDIMPELFQGTIDRSSGKVELQFSAKFWFSVGSIYRAPPLMVQTTLTSEESRGAMRSGRGERLDSAGRCRLVGVAVVDPINDALMDSFLGLPTECIASLNAQVSFSSSS